LLQEGGFEPVGSSRTRRVDVRVVAATNQDLGALVEAKAFREDLFYRLHVVRVHLPPLRERREDIAGLAHHFLQAAAARNALPPRKLSKKAVAWLETQPWPGNVRQLKNVIEGAAVLAEAADVEPADLQAVATPLPSREPGGATDWFHFEKLEDFRAATEKEFLRRKLLEFGGNIKRTAENIELQRSNLYKKLERYDLK
jgi:two-component system nitrogen regulation response regulator NtrX